MKARLLLDENVPAPLKLKLKDAGYDVEHVNNVAKGKKDSEILEYAYKHKRTIISIDSDFCKFREKEHYGLIKISGMISNPIVPLLELLEKFKMKELKDQNFQIDPDRAYLEIKKYTKKEEFKQFHRIPIDLNCFSKS